MNKTILFKKFIYTEKDDLLGVCMYLFAFLITLSGFYRGIFSLIWNTLAIILLGVYANLEIYLENLAKWKRCGYILYSYWEMFLFYAYNNVEGCE